MKSLILAVAILGIHTAAAEPPQKSEPRKTAAFTAIELAGTLMVEARVGSAISVEVRGDVDRVDKVTTDVKNGVLVIDNKAEANTKKPKDSKLTVIVTLPALAAISISGTGAFKATGLAGDRLRANVAGTGQLTLVGAVGELELAVPGTAQVVAKDLVAAAATVEVPGTVDASVHATKSLVVGVDGTARIKIHGSPTKVTKRINGTALIN